MYFLGGLIWYGILGLIVFLVWNVVSHRSQTLRNLGPKVSPITVVLALVLTVAVIALFTQIWNDLIRLIQPSGARLPRVDYYGSGGTSQLALNALFVHTLFVVPLVVLSVFVFLAVRDKGSRYGAVTLPFFIGSFVMVLRLLFDAGSFVISNYGRLGIYIVLAFVIVVFGALIFYVQAKWEEHKEDVPAPQPPNKANPPPLNQKPTQDNQ